MGEITYYRDFPSGYYSNRNPLSAPIDRGEDAAISGLNMIHTEQLTWKRRPGLQLFSEDVSTLTTVKNMFSYEPVADTVHVLIDNSTSVDILPETSGALVNVFTKTATTSHFQAVKRTLYVTASADVSGHKKKIGLTTAKRWGITTPTAAPSVNTVGGGTLRGRIGYRYVYVYRDETDGHLSSASPISTPVAKGQNRIHKVTVWGSPEPRVSHVDLYRTKDGGSTFYFHSSVVNNGGGVMPSIDDQTTDENLNTALIAPSQNSNNPPPDQMTLLTYHRGRLWGTVDNILYYSNHSVDGPVYGVPEECWNPLNNFEFPSTITAIHAHDKGLLVFDASDTHLVTGSSKYDFSPDKLWERIGVHDFLCVRQDGDFLYVYTHTMELLQINEGINRISIPLHKSDLPMPESASIGIVNNDKEHAVYLHKETDHTTLRYGVTTGTWSLPFDYDDIEPSKVWPIRTSVDDFRILFSSEDGLVRFLEERDDFDYEETTILCRIIIGDLLLASPGEVADLHMINVESLEEPVTVKFCLDEVDNNTMHTIPDEGTVNDPPTILATGPPLHFSKRFYPNMADNAIPLTGRHLRVFIQWSTAVPGSELLGMAVGFQPKNDNPYET